MEVLCRLSYSGAMPMITTALVPQSWEHVPVPRAATSILTVLLLAPLLAGCGGGDRDATRRATSVLTIGEGSTAVELGVEVADDPEERSRGLMGRTSLPEDRGMVFLFENPTTASFWMKDTRIPLSIAFWDEDETIVEILDMEPCEADPCPTYGPGVPYVGAVEVNEGWFARNRVEVGEPVELRT